MRKCECADPRCHACNGVCEREATETLYRIDMLDVSGTRFCEPCSEDAYQSGLFTSAEDLDADEQ